MTPGSSPDTTRDASHDPIAARENPVINQAAATGPRPEFERSTSRGLLLQEEDLLTPTGSENELPPPAYGDTYGEIRNEKGGLGTSASVGNDGRVNIRINQLNRRLSQTFNPALRNYAKSLEDTRPPPPPYIPPSLGGDDKRSPPPSLNIVIQVVGSRGDVQPFVALGKVLKRTYGHRVRLATHPNFKNFVEENGLEFFSIGGDPSKLMAFMVKNPGLMPGFRSVISGDVRQRRKDVAEYIQGCWRSCYQAGNGINDDPSKEGPKDQLFVADCIIANPPSFAHIHCAEKLGIPLHIMFTMPYSPTEAFPHPLTNIQSSNADAQLTNYMSYAMVEVLAWQGLGDIINRFRTKCLGLEEVSRIWAPGMLQRLKVPHTYCWSPSLIPKPADWGSHISISGFFFLDLASDYTPPIELQTFLDAGQPPVYIGFGSIVLDDPDAMTRLIFEAVEKTGQRVLLSKGWGGMGAGEGGLRVPEGVFMLGNVPHDWLFKQVSCVVHHGGAGTTAAGISAGRPTVVVPFFGDQPFWGAMIARAGAGPDPIPHRELTSERLADAINFCLRPESLDRAIVLAGKIATEQGNDIGAQYFHQFLEPDRLRCTLTPSRVAVWRLRRTRVKLSAFAACTLANAGLLDFNDLKLFRAQEYEVDEGPWDPVTGFAAATFGAFGNLVGGLGEFPAETYRAVRSPFTSKQAKSQASASTTTLSHMEEDGVFPGPSGPSSTRQEHGNSLATHDPAVGPSNESRKSLARSQTESSVIENGDPMRHTAHVSKGFGRMVKTAFDSPMDISIGMARGFHNTPKLWGDDTVRPQQQINDMKSGFQAIGKEFGYGMYDGVTGLVTQPWKGARKEGTSGFFKGIGKGIGGLAAKPGAALFSIPAFFMKGAYKEVQNMFGNNVHSYIIGSRTSEGYEEWMKSSETEKQDVIERWKLIQKYLKKKVSEEEAMRDLMEAYGKAGRASRPSSEDSANVVNASSSGAEHTMRAASASQEPASRNTPSHRTSGTSHPANENAHPESERGATSSSEVDAQRLVNETAEFERQLQLVIAQSLQDHILDNKHDLHEAQPDADGELPGPSSIARKPVSAPQQPPVYDPGHLEGTTKSEFEQQGSREKTAEEKTEEQIVLEYVKKQSLLEAVHQRNKGTRRSDATEDEEFMRAIEASMRDSGLGAEGMNGESSRSR